MNIRPRAKGYQVLVKLLEVKKTIDESIIEYSHEAHEKEQAGQILAKIIDIGPLAYKGFDCESPADWGIKVNDVAILAGRYQGSRIAYEGPYKDYRLVPDEAIVGALEDEHAES